MVMLDARHASVSKYGIIHVIICPVCLFILFSLLVVCVCGLSVL